MYNYNSFFSYIWGYYSTYILIVAGMVMCAVASRRMKKAFRKYSRVASYYGATGAQVAHQLLQYAGIRNVRIRMVRGVLTDHYNPLTKTLSLSHGIYDSTSIAAVCIAAHECGHAIQHQRIYIPLYFRLFMVPVTNIASKISWPVIIAGMFFSRFSSELGEQLVQGGIVMFAVAVVFQIITLPVEFNASRRALRLLEKYGYLAPAEMHGARRVLRAAAMTYVASTIASFLQWLRIVIVYYINRRN